MIASHDDFVVIPEVTVYDASRDEDIRLTGVCIDAAPVCDRQGRVMYFDVAEADAYLARRGKSMASLPLLLNIYLALEGLSGRDEAAASLFARMNSGWDRTGTSVDPAGSVLHADSVLGEIAVTGLKVPLAGNGLDELYGRHADFFRALLGVRNLDRLMGVAGRADVSPFYWYPRGPRRVMFGGGDFYYMHQHLPGLLMVFCDDEPHPRRALRGVWQDPEDKLAPRG